MSATRFKFLCCLACGFLYCSAGSIAQTTQLPGLQSLTEQLCNDIRNGIRKEGELLKGVGHGGLEVSSLPVGTRYTVRFADAAYFELDAISGRPEFQQAGVLQESAQQESSQQDKQAPPRQYLGTQFSKDSKPQALVSLDGQCARRLGKRIHYDTSGRAEYVTTVDEQLVDIGPKEWLNPAVPAFEPDKTVRLRVGMIDSGVNYLLPEINRRLARTDEGKLLGYDYWEQDYRPFDTQTARSPFFLQRHGTRTASLLLHEAPAVDLVVYRYPRPDMRRMKALIDHADRHNVHILGMPLGSNNQSEWLDFKTAAAAHPHMLFVVSAGNNGRDIDDEPLYPAVFDLPNIIVVTSADDFARAAERTNWGALSVDYLLPAELQVVTDFTGEPAFASGSSYAVSRMTALAANLKVQNRNWAAAEISSRIRRLAIPIDSGQVAIGYIPDPLRYSGNHPLVWDNEPVTHKLIKLDAAVNQAELTLSLDILQLDSRWDEERVSTMLEQTFDFLQICGISKGTIAIYAVESADYLRNLGTGTAHTLLTTRPGSGENAVVVLARDTFMQDPYEAEAFGLGNTRTRPWLRYSVWLTESIQHESIALAHELFHVLANDGRHVEDTGNLLQERTQAGNTRLTEEQCEAARTFGIDSGLLQRQE